MKVTLRDVTKVKQLDSDESDMAKAVMGSMSEAIRELENENSESNLSERVAPKDPLTGMFTGMHKELLKKRDDLYNSGFNPSPKEQFEDSSYLSDEQIDAGEEIANKLNNLFGGRS